VSPGVSSTAYLPTWVRLCHLTRSLIGTGNVSAGDGRYQQIPSSPEIDRRYLLIPRWRAQDSHDPSVEKDFSPGEASRSGKHGRLSIKGVHMTEPVPDTELIGAFSSPDAKPTEWSQALHELDDR
jgi:hypothetical protein